VLRFGQFGGALTAWYGATVSHWLVPMTTDKPFKSTANITARRREADFATLFTREHAYVRRVLKRLEVRDADVEDLINEIFLRV
jgi:hypothetical protein